MYEYIIATTFRGIVTVLTITTLVQCTEDANLFFLLTALSVIGSAFVAFSGSALITRLAYNRKVATAIFSLITVWCGVLTIVAIFVASFVFNSEIVLKSGWYFFWKLLEMLADSLMLACGKRHKLTRMIILNTAIIVLLNIIMIFGFINTTQDFLLVTAITGTTLYSAIVFRSHFIFSKKSFFSLIRLSVRRYKHFVLPLSLTTIGAALMSQGDKLMLGIFAEPEFASTYGFTFVCCFYTYRFFTVAFLQYVEAQYFRYKSEENLIKYSNIGILVILFLNTIFYMIWSKTSLLDKIRISDDEKIVLQLLLENNFLRSVFFIFFYSIPLLYGIYALNFYS